MVRIRDCRVRGCHGIAVFPHHYCLKHLSLEKQEQHHESKQQVRYYNRYKRNRNPIKAKQNKFYHTKQWQEMRLIVLNRDYSLCQYCKALGITKEGNVIDHVLPIERFPEKMKDISNLVVCCNSCHYWKTRWEEKYYGTGLHGRPTENPPVSNIKIIANASEALKQASKQNKIDDV